MKSNLILSFRILIGFALLYSSTGKILAHEIIHQDDKDDDSSSMEKISPETDTTQRFYRECTRTSDCPESYCCVLGMMRYQMPYCLPIGRVQDPCHPYGESYRSNFTLNFPNADVHIEESYLLMCPCDKGLFCSKNNATCSTLVVPENNIS